MSAEPKRPHTLLTVATSLIALSAVVGVYFLVTGSKSAEEPTEPTVETEGQQVSEGHDYRVLIAVARINPVDEDGDTWDSGSESSGPPDPYYEIWWRDNRVFESQEVENVLVASWSNVALPSLLALLTDEELSFESIKEGALITARSGDNLQIRITDRDPLSNDLIEEFDIPVDDLLVGDQEVPGMQGIESLTLRVIPRDSNELRQLIR